MARRSPLIRGAEAFPPLLGREQPGFAPRLPGLIVPPYDPPVPPPPPPPAPQPLNGVGAGYESTNVLVPIPSGSEVLTYATQGRWRGLDVYVDTGPIPYQLLAHLAVAVYAVTRGIRVLVATGRVRDTGATYGGFRRMVGVRLPQAERYEVTSYYNAITSGTITTYQMAVIASDDVNPAADDDPDGSMALNFKVPAGAVNDLAPQLSTGTSASVTSQIPFRLVGIHATALVAARWIHVHAIGGASYIGAAPLFSFGLPSIGSSLFGTESKLFGVRRFGTCLVAISTTGDVTTVASSGDVAWNAWVR